MAQMPAGTPANQGGPMVFEETQSHYAVAPEFKVTEVDGTTAELLGGHGGVLLGKNLLVGAGLYTMVNGSHGQGLTYGGGVVGWNAWGGNKLSLSLRGLIGLGSGSASSAVTLTTRDHRELTGERRFESSFLVAEPQADVLLRLTRHLQLGVGAGYRFIGDSHTSDTFTGATGSLSLRIGRAQ